mgnify:FL=1
MHEKSNFIKQPQSTENTAFSEKEEIRGRRTFWRKKLDNERKTG